ncbi:TetR/AcrR family transcriptional regulator [Myxococcota bacterium]|nr:TetR/AcrR family transcriptional regulator [Myxococcota bacterium]MBU1381644.1 TetR/AcrR family transcriptional regulator [Myxococcota bacterium]MBU1495473.1 TetR/AcrR family transcriptional regulator [Myxococcota bacterium]
MPGPRFYNLSEEKQSLILEAAKLEFIEKGYNDSSLNRIIEKAGISKGAMYYYFNDKNDLLGTVLENAITSLVSKLGTDFIFSSREDFWEVLKQLMVKAIETPEFHECLIITRQIPSRYLESLFHDHTYPQLNHLWIGSIIENGQKLGAIRDQFPGDLASEITSHLFSTLDTWLIPYIDHIDHDVISELVDANIEILKAIFAPGHVCDGNKFLVFRRLERLRNNTVV